LGLKTGAGRDEIKTAFKKLVFQYHPDRNPHNEWAEEKFKEVVEAYSYLTGNQEAYQALKTGSRSAQATSEQIQDIFKILFDVEPKSTSRRSRPAEIFLDLTLEEAFRGGDRKISFERWNLCNECQGSGIEAGAKVFTCTYCFGEGEVGKNRLSEVPKECPKCNGRGFLSSKGCVTCRARGVVKARFKRTVTLPVKLIHGQMLTFPGEGHEYEPGRRSDLKLTVRLIKHPRFTFDGKDVICEITIPMSQAALGGEIAVPTLNGFQRLAVPPGTQSGQVFRFKGWGLGGDQLIRVWVKTPVAVSERERIFFQTFQQGQDRPSHSFWSRIKKWIW
jgi:molecular chaperone DnaJ